MTTETGSRGQNKGWNKKKGLTILNHGLLMQSVSLAKFWVSLGAKLSIQISKQRGIKYTTDKAPSVAIQNTNNQAKWSTIEQDETILRLGETGWAGEVCEISSQRSYLISS